jgi:hypothetical protein
MGKLRSFLLFWYRFIVGDDWRIAAGVVIALSIAAALSLAGINAWFVFPLIIVGGLLVSLRRAIKATKHDEDNQAYLVSLARSWFVLWGPLLMLGIFPVLASYLSNVSETSVQDLILPIVLNVVAVTIVAAILFGGFLKQRFTFYITAVIMTFIIANNYAGKSAQAYNILISIWPYPVPLVVFSLAFIIVLFFLVHKLSQWLNRYAIRHKWRTNEIMMAVTIAIGTTFLLQFIPTVVDLAEAWPQFFYQPPAMAALHPTAAEAAAKPDIYYILLEDYTSQQVLQSQMNFDNSSFLNTLAGQGFYNVPAASSNYPYTVNSVASTLNADYLSDSVNQFSKAKNQTMIPYFNTSRLSPVIQQLKAIGYKYDLLGDWYETSNYSPLADQTFTNDDEIFAFNHRYDLDDFTDSLVQQNIFWQIIQPGLSFGKYRLLGYNTESNTDQIQSQLQELRNLANGPAGGKVVFSQILVPHNFFYYNADGSMNVNANEDNNGATVATKDTNEIQYINNQITPIIAQIMKSTGGKANIILQSDEGPQPLAVKHGVYDINQQSAQENQGNMTTLSASDLQMKYGVLASYYIPGASTTGLAQAADPVNVFRLLFNTDFSSALAYRPLCYYAYPQGNDESFVYKSITKTISGQANSSCPQNGNFIKPGPTKLVKSGAAHTNADEAGDD